MSDYSDDDYYDDEDMFDGTQEDGDSEYPPLFRFRHRELIDCQSPTTTWTSGKSSKSRPRAN